MNEHEARIAVARRSFLSRLGAGAAAFGAAFGAARGAGAQSAPSPAGAWQPARHAEDDWFEPSAAKHRFFVDTTTADGLGKAIFWCNNFFNASRSGYGLQDADSAVIIGVRHESTPFAYNDAMWKKYGDALAEHAVFVDPKTKQHPTTNLYLATGYGQALTNRGVTITTVTGHGLRLSVCQLATRAIAGAAAQKSGGKTDDIFKELADNLLPNAHLVPAGIIAVNRAQERGYTFGSVA